MKNKHLPAAAVALMLSALLPGFACAAPKSTPVSIGTAKMLPDGTLSLKMRPGWSDACEEETQTIKPTDRFYASIKAQFEGIKPGEVRAIPPEHHNLNSAANPHAPGLEVSLHTDRQSYRLGDSVSLTILLKNVTRDTTLYIFDEVALDESGTLFLRTRDAADKTLKEGELTSDPMPPPPSCHSFMRLMPGHLYGITINDNIANMGISQPGTYHIIAGYRAPFRADSEFSFGLAFWGEEMGDIPAAPVDIVVTK